jgi:GDP-4-dehydro-6-deoxy-D-mannose reductase
VNVLVTGANGFVGSYLVPHLVAEGHAVIAAVHTTPEESSPDPSMLASADEVIELDLAVADSVQRLPLDELDAVVHLAAMASVGDSLANPGLAWTINAAGTARLAELAAAGAGRRRVVFLLVSSGEVYGPAGDQRPLVETSPVSPGSPYAASKLGAEIAVLEIGRRTALHVVVARPFGHTGPRQAQRYVVPAFARRVQIAKKVGAPVVTVGNLDPVREFMHVRDVVDAYTRLLQFGKDGEIYNIASGHAVSLREVFLEIADISGHAVIPEVDTALVRAVDVPYLVGDARKLTEATGWRANIPLSDTLREVVNAQAY